MSKLTLVVLTLSLIACGGGGDAGRICQAAHDCGSITEDEIDPCTDALGQVDADRALGECADCLEQHTCGDIDDGECASTCEPAFDALDAYREQVWRETRLEALTDDQVASLCDDIVWSLGGPGDVDFCDDGSEVTVGTEADCRTAIADLACGGVVGDVLDCLDATDGDACYLLDGPECRVFVDCSL
jgi:hypothetical protein